VLAAGLLAAPLLVAATPATAAAPARRAAACTRVPSDFNGDGYGDLAAGASESTDDIRQPPPAGRLYVLYGSAAGLNRGAVPALALTTRSPGMPAAATRLARWGHQVTSGYFDDDCFADVAVNAEGGGFTLLYGSSAGLRTARSQAFDYTAIPDVRPHVQTYPKMAAADFNGDGRDDLAVGANGSSDADPIATGGAVGILYGSTTGISTSGARWISQDSPGLPGAPASLAGFGGALAAADFDADGHADLAVGAPTGQVGGEPESGVVVVLRGGSGGLTTDGAQVFGQDTAGVPGTGESGDAFAASLAAGDVTGDRRADLVVGAPYESIPGQPSAGTVTVLRSGPGGVTSAGAVRFDQDTAGIPGTAEWGDEFGSSFAIGDLNRDGRPDLVVGTPLEAVGTTREVGSVTVLYGRSGGLSAEGARSVHQDSPGVPGTNDGSDRFGSALRTIRDGHTGRDALAIGASGEFTPVGTTWYNGAVTVLPSAASGLPGPTGTRFTPDLLPGATPGWSYIGASLA
jgi:hypothetical protein